MADGMTGEPGGLGWVGVDLNAQRGLVDNAADYPMPPALAGT